MNALCPLIIVGSIALFALILVSTKPGGSRANIDIIAQADAIEAAVQHGDVRDGKGRVLGEPDSNPSGAEAVVAIEPTAATIGVFVHALASDSRREVEHLLAATRADHPDARIMLDLKDFPGTYRALVLPELQKGRMLLDANERRTLREWVLEAGGRLIVTGDYHGHAVELLNQVFGKAYKPLDHAAVADGQQDRDGDGAANAQWDGSLPASMAKEAVQTDAAKKFFAKGPATLPPINAVWPLDSSSVPDSEQMFVHVVEKNTVAAAFTYGRGVVYYLGYDWFQVATSVPWNIALWSALDL